MNTKTKPLQSKAIRTLPTAVCAAALTVGALWATAARADDDCALRVAGGPTGKVYEQIIKDMRNVCGDTVSMCSVATTGGAQNLQLLSSNEADLGLVQIDLLQKLKDSDSNVGSLKAVMPLHSNLLHVLALTEGSMVDMKRVPGTYAVVPFTGRKAVLRRFSELRGMTVALVGSAQLTAQLMEERLRYNLQFVPADTDDQAVAMLRRGEVQAVFTLAGWPMPMLGRLRSDSGISLVEFDTPAWAPYKVAKRNYQGMGALNLPMLAVPNLLVARSFKATGTQGQRVSALQTCLGQQLDELKDGRFQAAWKEIGDISDTQGWARWQTAPAEVGKTSTK